jgi:glucose-1-phosphate thymidylyltransferase
VAEVVAVVLARGLGRRMREGSTAGSDRLTPEQAAAADAGFKPMMPMAGAGRGRPFLDYALSALGDAGVRRVALVIGPEHDRLRKYYEGAAAARLSIDFVVQAEALGTADAVRSAETFVGVGPFLVVNADNLYPIEVLRALVDADGPALPAFERDDLVASSGIPPERVASFALISVADDGTLAGIIEKPGPEVMAAAGARALVSMNCWRFDARIFAACRDVPRSPRGEFELPDAVRLAMTRGVRFRVIAARGPVLDLSRREDIGVVERQLSGRQVVL